MSSDIQFSDESLLPEQLKQDFERKISNLDYDYFSLFQKYVSSILTYLTCCYIQKEQLFSSLRIFPDSCKKCEDRLAQSYHKENLYHNIMYAFDITHTEIGKPSKT